MITGFDFIGSHGSNCTEYQKKTASARTGRKAYGIYENRKRLELGLGNTVSSLGGLGISRGGRWHYMSLIRNERSDETSQVAGIVNEEYDH